MAEPRSTTERQRDTLARLGGDTDVWVATADPATGTPFLTPLSFLWDGDTILLATPATTRTGANLISAGRVRLGLGLTRDVTIIDGMVTDIMSTDAIPAETAAAFAAATGFDPREESGDYRYFRIRPDRVQAWREANELAGRTLMRDGAWR